jgi:hypothetical protein
MLHLESDLGISVTAIDPWFFSSSDGVQLLAHRYVLPLITQNHARKVAWTFCAWAAPSPVEPRDEGAAQAGTAGSPRPSSHPQRREILLATFIDAEVVEHWAAPLVRTGGPVVVGNWIPSKQNVGGGPLITTIQEALR